MRLNLRKNSTLVFTSDASANVCTRKLKGGNLILVLVFNLFSRLWNKDSCACVASEKQALFLDFIWSNCRFVFCFRFWWTNWTPKWKTMFTKRSQQCFYQHIRLMQGRYTTQWKYGWYAVYSVRVIRGLVSTWSSFNLYFSLPIQHGLTSYGQMISVKTSQSPILGAAIFFPPPSAWWDHRNTDRATDRTQGSHALFRHTPLIKDQFHKKITDNFLSL